MQNVPSSTPTASLWSSTWKQDAILEFIDNLTLTLAANLMVILNCVLVRIQRVDDAGFDLRTVGTKELPVNSAPSIFHITIQPINYLVAYIIMYYALDLIPLGF